MQKRDNQKREVKSNFMVLVFVGLASTVFGKLSLGVRFPDIVIEKAEPGAVYNLRQLRGIHYVVMNRSDKPVEVEVVIQAPQQKDMKDGYEPIPDVNWIKAVPAKFHMEVGDVTPADVVLSIPNDPALVGRHFQAHILSRTTGKELFQVGVVSAVRFSVGTLGPDALKAEAKPQAALMNFDVDVAPQTYQAPEVPLGRPVDLKKERGFSLKLSNRGDTPLKFKVTPVGADARLRVGGYDAGDPAWVAVKPLATKVKPNRIEEIRVTLHIPNVPENAGRKFMFPIKFELEGMEIPLELYGKLLVTTKGEKKE